MTDINIYHTASKPSIDSLAVVLKVLQPLSLSTHCQLINAPITQKWIKSIPDTSLVIDDYGEVALLGNGLAVRPKWSALQQRVVKAGKKSELLLKAMRLQPTMTVIDATAGFGHDSLILASTGAEVVMIEQHPLLYVLLKLEIQTMSHQPNWQKLISRLSVYFGDSSTVISQLPKADRIYLDPMFPAASYKAAVNKHMQLLHQLITPPNDITEQQLLHTAITHLQPTGLLLVKRPKNAPFLANLKPLSSYQNALVRFDEYNQTSLSAIPSSTQ